MAKRVSLTIDDEAAAILADRSRIRYLEQGNWVSAAIKQAAQQEDSERTSLRARIAEVEKRFAAEIAALKAEIEQQA